VGIKETADPLAKLAPGDAIAATAKLFFDGSRWTLTEPGRYVVLARYAESVDAPPLTLGAA
jgi:hypothetical protein